MNVTLTISKRNIFHHVSMSTAYIGGKRAGGENYETVALTDSEFELMERFWAEAVAEAVEMLTPWIKESNQGELPHGTDLDADLHLTLSTYPRAIPTIESQLKRYLETYLIETLTARWLMVLGLNPEAHVALSIDALKSASKVLYHKTPPNRNI